MCRNLKSSVRVLNVVYNTKLNRLKSFRIRKGLKEKNFENITGIGKLATFRLIFFKDVEWYTSYTTPKTSKCKTNQIKKSLDIHVRG